MSAADVELDRMQVKEVDAWSHSHLFSPIRVARSFGWPGFAINGPLLTGSGL
jgi:hypothetical protein